MKFSSAVQNAMKSNATLLSAMAVLALIIAGCATSTSKAAPLPDSSGPSTWLHDSNLDDKAVHEQLRNEVKLLFFSEQFTQLDALAEHFRQSQERTSSGLWMLDAFYGSFDMSVSSLNANERYVSALFDKADRWIEQSPQSPTAHIVKGILLTNYAWHFRGRPWEPDFPKESEMKAFGKHLRIAKKYVFDNKKYASVDPHWYVTAATILTGVQADRDSFMAVMNEGMDAFPYYYQLYFSTIEYLEPKWGHDWSKLEEFANRAAQRTKQIDGMGVYARIYWYVYDSLYIEDLLRRTNVAWPKMREGIFDILKKYPDDWNVQHFAYFSCVAHDRATTKKLLDKIGLMVMMSAWKKHQYYTLCREFANSAVESESDTESFAPDKSL